ncbi:MAG: hypothetical protein ACPGUZ_01825 [Holosporaceae bacterium]
MLKRIFWCAAVLCCVAASLKAGNRHANRGELEKPLHVEQLLPGMYLENILEDCDLLKENKNYFYAPYPLALTEEALCLIQHEGLSFENALETLRPFVSISLGTLRLKESVGGLCAQTSFAEKAALLAEWGIHVFDVEGKKFDKLQKKISDTVCHETNGHVQNFGDMLINSFSLYTVAYSAFHHAVEWRDPFDEREIHKFYRQDQSYVYGTFMVGKRLVRMKQNRDEIVLCLPLEAASKPTPVGHATLLWFARRPSSYTDQCSFEEAWLKGLEEGVADLRIPCLSESHLYNEDIIVQKTLYVQDSVDTLQSGDFDAGAGGSSAANVTKVYLDQPHTVSLVLKLGERYLELLSGYVGTVESAAEAAAGPSLGFKYPSDRDLLTFDMDEMVQAIAEYSKSV